MKHKLKKIIVKSKLIYLFRGIKYIWLILKPSNLFSNIVYLFRGSHDGFPVPPIYLIYLTINNPSLFDYFRGGYITSRSIKRLLKKNDINANDFESILDFGSGCGRVIRDFSNLENAELYGSDYNPKLVNWCQKNLYCANFSANKLNPPLGFEDKKFDFTYLISVFTHLPKDTQLSWLKEFHRVTKSNKYLLITLHGEHIVKKLTQEEKELFLANGYVERDLDAPGSNHYGTFHTKEYFEKMIHGMFKIVDVSYGGAPNHPYQDLYLLQKVD
jgi:SAM-dependent methyltransferase